MHQKCEVVVYEKLLWISCPAGESASGTLRIIGARERIWWRPVQVRIIGGVSGGVIGGVSDD